MIDKDEALGRDVKFEIVPSSGGLSIMEASIEL